jgi:hypothetical protein
MWRAREIGESCSVQHTYTIGRYTQCASFLLIILRYIIHQLFLVTDIPPFPSCHSNVKAFVYFVVFYISNFSLQMSFLETLRAPMLGPAKSSASRRLFNPSRACVSSSL